MATTKHRRFAHTLRDGDIYRSLELGPMTAKQLLALSSTWPQPFTSLRRIQERLKRLADAGFVRLSWYATATRGGGPAYYQLTATGYRLLHQDEHVKPPTKRFFARVPVSSHNHKHRLMEVVVHTLVQAHGHGLPLVEFFGENQLSLPVGDQTVLPDTSLSIRLPSGRLYHFFFEVDNSTVTLVSDRTSDTIERRLTLYDRYRDECGEPFCVAFFTASPERRDHILNRAAELTSNPSRRLFVATTLNEFLAGDALCSPCFRDNYERSVSLIARRQLAAIPKPTKHNSFVPSLAPC